VPNHCVDLSVVIPAYNESRRLPPYLAEVRSCLELRYGNRLEVIVVDDGSRDSLEQALSQAVAEWPSFRFLRHAENQGKGAAVRTGVLAARGELVLFADADGATPIEEEHRLAEAIRGGADIAIGSRLATGLGVRRSRRWARGLAGRLFAVVARGLVGLSIRDTQCGFKMFRAAAAQRLFAMVCEPRYLFDLEVLALASRLGYTIAEVPISWTEIPGGHLSLARELPKVVCGLWRLRQRLREA